MRGLAGIYACLASALVALAGGDATVRAEGRMHAQVSWHGSILTEADQQEDGQSKDQGSQRDHVPLKLTLSDRGPRYPSQLFRCPAEAAHTTASLTAEQYQHISDRVGELMEPVPNYCPSHDCDSADFQGCVLRLAAHDFMDYQEKASSAIGGSDGCLDFHHEINAGLAECIEEVDLLGLYEESCENVSLADFIVIAAESVILHSRKRAAVHGGPDDQDALLRVRDLQRQFRYGRTTAPTCASSAHLLPNPEGGQHAIEECFIDRLRLSWPEAAALMGGHVAARARHNGDAGWWTAPRHANVFDNAYFVAMLTHGWRMQLPPHGITVEADRRWSRSDVANQDQLMLGTDLCLAYDIDHNNSHCCAWEPWEKVSDIPHKHCSKVSFDAGLEAQRKACCNAVDAEVQTCVVPDRGRAIDAVRRYAAHETEWLHAFASAWSKVTLNGYPGLTPITSADSDVAHHQHPRSSDAGRQAGFVVALATSATAWLCVSR
mmetsp:Transcript_54380/g.122170  ORF Transcript_54380/g.122170 Transcript_54380/m.122170 type:complete len:491 (-) Transcript_54380:46-1518(-)